MIAGDHDDLDTGGPALGHGVRDGGAGRVNHRHEADEAQALQGEVDLVAVEGVVARVLVAREGVVTETCEKGMWSERSDVGG